MKLRQFSVATVNLYNLQLPGAAMNPNQRPWTTTEFDAKVTWLAARLTALDADVIGLQELWHREALAAVLQAAGLTDRYDLLAEPANGDRIVCAALVRRGLLHGTPRWVDRFPDGVVRAAALVGTRMYLVSGPESSAVLSVRDLADVLSS